MNTKKIFVFVFLFFSSFFIFKTNSLAKLPSIDIDRIIPLIQPTNTPTPIKIIKIEITGIIEKIPSIVTNTSTPNPTNTPVPTVTITPTIEPKTTTSKVTSTPTISASPSETSPTVTPNVEDTSSKSDSLLITVLAGVAISAWIIYGIVKILKNKKNN